MKLINLQESIRKELTKREDEETSFEIRLFDSQSLEVIYKRLTRSELDVIAHTLKIK